MARKERRVEAALARTLAGCWGPWPGVGEKRHEEEGLHQPGRLLRGSNKEEESKNEETTEEEGRGRESPALE